LITASIAQALTIGTWADPLRPGCAYAGQCVDARPVGLHDVRLDAVATEHGIIQPEGR